MTGETNRVDVDHLEIGDDQAYYFDGAPFNGIAVYYREDGTIEGEVELDGGIPNGISRDWNSDGQLVREEELRGGVCHGMCRAWDDSGRLIQEDTFEHGIRTSRRRWSANGTLIEKTDLRPGDSDYELLEAARRAFAFEEDGEAKKQEHH